jgi:CubicO group peptidase (beta-lactamase class C family)
MHKRRKLAGGVFAALGVAAGVSLPAGVLKMTHAASRQEQLSAATDEIFADVAKPGSPGCALAVAREGKLLYEKGYGFANLEQNVPITPQTVFDIGSTSKQFSASSILLLEKQGKLSINDDIRKYVPEIPDYGKKITILNLLNHTSGLRDYLTLMVLAGIPIDGVTGDDDALGIVARQKALNFEPGSEWLYSNTGYFLLSIIVKRVSGMTLREFAAENLFEPLQMTHTQYRDDHAQLIPNRGLAYEQDEKTHNWKLDVSYFEQTGDGAVHTTVEDLLKWDENFYTAKVGGKAFLDELQEAGKLNSGKTLEYAKGLFIGNYRGLKTVSHGGAWGGYRAELLRFPEQHFSVVCLCNVGNADPERRAKRVADVYLSSLLKPKDSAKNDDEERSRRKQLKDLTGELSAAELQAVAGDYWSDELAVSYRFAVANGAIRLVKITDAGGFPRALPFSDTALKAVGTDQFALADTGISLQFQRANGRVSSFELEAGRTKGMIFVRKGSESR